MRGLPKFCREIPPGLAKKAPIICLIIGGGLVTASVIFASIESKKAEQRKQELKEHDVKLKKFDYVKALVPCYKKTIMSFTGGMALAACGSYISMKRLAKAVIAEEATRKAYKVTRKAIYDVVGDKKADEIDTEVAKAYNPEACSSRLILFKDGTMGGTFRLTSYDVRNAVNEANDMLGQEALSVNRYFELFEREPIGTGDRFGFSKNVDPMYKIEIFPDPDPSTWATEIDPVTGEPCVIFEYSMPWEGFDRNF